MESCIFNYQSTCVSEGLHILLTFWAQPFLGLFGEAASPPINFTPAFCSGWHLPIGLFKQGAYSNTADIFLWLSDMSDLDSLSRATLHSCRSFRLFNASDVFGGGSKMVWWTCRRFPWDLVWESVLIFWRYPSCCQVSLSILLPLDGSALVVSSWSRCSVMIKGIRDFWRDCFALVSGVLGSLLPAFCARRPLTKKFSTGCLPFSLTGFLV